MIEFLHGRAYTLIQTLVVIGMIVLLMAILIPAVHLAIYQAALARCSSHLKSITTGANTYAVQHNRLYPVLPRLPWNTEKIVRRPDYLGNGGLDDFRPMVAPFLSVDSLACPLSPEISLDLADTGTSLSFSNYSLFMGWRYTPEGKNAEEGMIRLGEDWSWEGTRFKVMAGDFDYNYVNPSDEWDGTHPDDDGKLLPIRSQDEASGGERFTTSFWSSDTTSAGRGLINTNSALNDGSVHRYNDVKPRDPRMRGVPLASTSGEKDVGRYYVAPD